MRGALLAALTCLLLAGCGGGGGSSGPPSTPLTPPAPTRNVPPLFLYFGIGGRQLEETADHCSCAYPMDWGDWDTMGPDIADRIIAQLTDAKLLGYKSAIVPVGFCMFTAKFAYKGNGALVAFRSRVEAAGVPIVGISIVDEPDMNGISDAVYSQAIRDARAVWPVPVFVIYGDHGTPGAAEADVIGSDDYGKGVVTLPLRPKQQLWIIAGGADPWRNDPKPFVNYAQAHPECAAICCFLWIDGWGGTMNKGIGTNGLAPAYRAAALSLRSTGA